MSIKVWKDKAGKKLTFKEFFSRWKQGVEGITPKQQVQSVLYGYWILVAGIIWGIIYSVATKMYWLSCMMVGALIINIFGLVGIIQKSAFIKRAEIAMNTPMVEQPKPDYIA